MSRHFNTAGPNDPKEHYYIDSFERVDWLEIKQLFDQKKYFILHAPRQSGKTTLLSAIVERLNGEGRYAAMRFSVQSAQAARSEKPIVSLPYLMAPHGASLYLTMISNTLPIWVL